MGTTTVTEAEYFARLRDEQESAKAVRTGTILGVILDPDRHIPAGETEVWRALYVATQLTGSDGKPTHVSASVHRNSDDVLMFRLVTAGNVFQLPGLWSPFDALVWFSLETDESIWKRDPDYERLYKAMERASAAAEKAEKGRIFVPRGPLAHLTQD